MIFPSPGADDGPWILELEVACSNLSTAELQSSNCDPFPEKSLLFYSINNKTKR